MPWIPRETGDASVAQEDAALEGKDLDEFHPYMVNDQGFNLRGLPFNLTVSWNVMPLVGTNAARSTARPT